VFVVLYGPAESRDWGLAGVLRQPLHAVVGEVPGVIAVAQVMEWIEPREGKHFVVPTRQMQQVWLSRWA
jgi:hypothetical protein